MKLKECCENPEKLILAIKESFADVSYPGDKNIVPEQYLRYGEYQDTKAFFRRHHWQDLLERKQSLPAGWGGLSFLTPRAWCFYLPAYMIAVLDDDSESYITYNVLFHLTPPSSSNLEAYFQERVDGFSMPQRHAIFAFLQCLCANFDDDMCEAALHFWSQFADNRNDPLDFA